MIQDINNSDILCRGDNTLYYEFTVFLTAHLSADVLSAILTSVF